MRVDAGLLDYSAYYLLCRHLGGTACHGKLEGTAPEYFAYNVTLASVRSYMELYTWVSLHDN